MNYNERPVGLPQHRHGSPYDRGSADAWYGREPNPHYYLGATYRSEKVIVTEGSAAYYQYMAGYKDTPFAQKEWQNEKLCGEICEAMRRWSSHRQSEVYP